MAQIIGINSAKYNDPTYVANTNYTLTQTSTPKMSDQHTATAVADEYVTEIGVYSWYSASTATVRVDLYDVTGGTNGATHEYTDTITGFTVTNQWYTKQVNWQLIENHTYSIALAVVSGGSFYTLSTPWTAGIGSNYAGINGTVPPPDPWVDSVWPNAWAGYGSTEVIPTVGDPTITFSDVNGNTDFVSITGTPATGSVNMSIFVGATLSTLPQAPNYEGPLVLTAGEGTLTLVGSDIASGTDVLVCVHQPGTNKRASFFTQVD